MSPPILFPGLCVAWREDENAENEWFTPVLFITPRPDEPGFFDPVITREGRIALARHLLPGDFEVRIDMDAYGLHEDV